MTVILSARSEAEITYISRTKGPFPGDPVWVWSPTLHRDVLLTNLQRRLDKAVESAGERNVSDRELAREQGVARSTLRSSMDSLVLLGRVVRHVHGRGRNAWTTYVSTAAPTALRNFKERMKRFFANGRSTVSDKHPLSRQAHSPSLEPVLRPFTWRPAEWQTDGLPREWETDEYLDRWSPRRPLTVRDDRVQGSGW